MKNMSNTIASLGIGLIVAGYLYALNAKWNLPLSDNPRTAFISFLVVGMAFCGVGIWHSVETVGFGNPLVMFGVGLGMVNMYIAYTAFTGGQFMFVNDYASASVAMSGIMLVKVIVKVAMNLIYIKG